MCITQSRRRKSFGLNLAAYTVANQKEAPGTTTSCTSTTNFRGPLGLSVPECNTSTTGTVTNTFVDHNGASFAAVSFPDVVPAGVTAAPSEFDVVSNARSTAAGSNTRKHKQQKKAARPVDELKKLEGKYVQGVYIPPSKPEPKRVRKPQKPGKTAKMHDRHFVQHNYHDHSDDVPQGPQPSAEAVELAILGKRTGRSVGVGKISFPRKLHFLLDQIERDGLAHVISWLPHGRAFAVHKPQEFTEHVMPKYFNQSKLTSFQRQLNLYGFSRLTRGRDSGGYYHELFLRGMPFLTKDIARTRVKGTKFKGASNPEEEPNFYAMKPVNMPGLQQHPAQPQMMSSTTTTSALVSGSEESSAVSSRRGSNSSSDNSYNNCIERALPITLSGSFDALSLPSQVVVSGVGGVAAGSGGIPFSPVLDERTRFAFSSARAIANAAAVNAATATIVPSVPSTPIKKTSMCDLWGDNLNVFEPNPYSPRASPIPTAVSVPTETLQAIPRLSPIPMSVSTSPMQSSSAAAVAPTLVPKFDTNSSSSSSSSSDDNDDEDSILDLLDDWVTGNDDFMDEVVEQALDNDLDFGHLLDIIAKE